MATKTIALDTSLKSHTKIHILFSCGAQCCTHLNHKALDFRWNRTDKVRVGLTEMAVRERVTTSLNHPRANWGIMHLRAPLLRSMEDFPFVTMKKLILWITLLNLTQFHRKLDFFINISDFITQITSWCTRTFFPYQHKSCHCAQEFIKKQADKLRSNHMWTCIKGKQ